MRKGTVTIPNRRVGIRSASIEAQDDRLVRDGVCPRHGPTRIAKMLTTGKWRTLCCGRLAEFET